MNYFKFHLIDRFRYKITKLIQFKLNANQSFHGANLVLFQFYLIFIYNIITLDILNLLRKLLNYSASHRCFFFRKLFAWCLLKH